MQSCPDAAVAENSASVTRAPMCVCVCVCVSVCLVNEITR